MPGIAFALSVVRDNEHKEILNIVHFDCFSNGELRWGGQNPVNPDGRTVMKNKSYILIFLVVFLTFRCATPRMYEGPPLPKEQVAIIKQKHFHSTYVVPLLIFFNVCYSTCRLVAIDNGKVNFIGRNTGVEISPGWYRVTVYADKAMYALSYYSDPLEFYSYSHHIYLRFNAEAGHKYLIEAPLWWTKKSYIRIIDDDSGEVVASEQIGQR